MQCCFCGKPVASIEEAIELDWYPDFWCHEVQYQGPVCADCQKEHLEADKDGEYLLKKNHPLPSSAVPLANPMKASPSLRHKFSLGQVVATPDALEAITQAGQTPDFFLDKHAQGDWGELHAEDQLLNDLAIVSGERILSAFRTLLNVHIWIITEAVGDDGNRTATTIILPEQY